MKKTVDNVNYSATVIRIHNLVKLEGATNLVGLPIFGMQAIISKEHTVGELGIVFPAECKLSDDFCKYNNLYRDATKNSDTTKSGYIEDSGRVKSLKLIKGKHISTCLFMPISSLSYLGVNPEDFQEGDAFDSINGTRVCSKYVIEYQNNGPKNKIRGLTKKFSRVDPIHFPEHLDTDNYWKNKHKLNDDDWIIVTAKLHGSSGRFGNTLVKKKLSRFEKVLKYFGFNIQETEYDTIAGSRRVIKDIKSNDQFDHYYDVDLWNQELEKIQHLIPKNIQIFGELVGWVGEKAIQPNYTYQIEKGKTELYVYRVAFINENGYSVDFSWKQVKEFCNNNGLKHVPELWQGYHKDFDESIYMNKKFVKDLGFRNCLPLDSTAEVDEGVCIRVDGIKPYILKAKSPVFLLGESVQLDTGIIDIESQESLGE
jgi:hypothetical protein